MFSYRKLSELEIQFTEKEKKKAGKRFKLPKKDKKKDKQQKERKTDDKPAEDETEEVKIKDPVKIKKAGTNVIALGLGIVDYCCWVWVNAYNPRFRFVG